MSISSSSEAAAMSTFRTWLDSLPGHQSLETAMLCTHVAQKPGLGVKSPLD